MKPFEATTVVIPCSNRDEAEETSHAMRARGDVLIARRPRWYVRDVAKPLNPGSHAKNAEWCVLVIEAEPQP